MDARTDRRTDGQAIARSSARGGHAVRNPNRDPDGGISISSLISAGLRAAS